MHPIKKSKMIARIARTQYSTLLLSARVCLKIQMRMAQSKLKQYPERWTTHLPLCVCCCAPLRFRFYSNNECGKSRLRKHLMVKILTLNVEKAKTCVIQLQSIRPSQRQQKNCSNLCLVLLISWKSLDYLLFVPPTPTRYKGNKRIVFFYSYWCVQLPKIYFWNT